MADIISPERRSKNMSAIRSKDTKPEIYLRKLLFAEGCRYRISEKTIPGHPDMFISVSNPWMQKTDGSNRLPSAAFPKP